MDFDLQEPLNLPLRVVGVVVLYHPPPDLERNVRSYLAAVDQLLVIDNTVPSVVGNWSSKFPANRIQWRTNEANEGIARPWNDAAKWASKQHADWLLVMDQDSFFAEGACEKWRIFLSSGYADSAGVVAPIHQTDSSKKIEETAGVTSIRFSMGSGCLVNLTAYRASGPFNEKLFLDLVDHEYCLRVRKNGYAVLQMNEVVLNHRLGTATRKGSISMVSHAPIRRYYRSRNRVWVMFEYLFFDPLYFLFEVRSAVTDLVKIMLVEKEKAASLRFFFLGMWHAIQGKHGRLGS